MSVYLRDAAIYWARFSNLAYLCFRSSFTNSAFLAIALMEVVQLQSYSVFKLVGFETLLHNARPLRYLLTVRSIVMSIETEMNYILRNN